jgi:hypothetical protein
MLDRWIHNATKPSPQQRARQQLKAARTQTRKTLAAMNQAYPDSTRSDEILHQHEQRVQTILYPRRKRPTYVRACDICGRPTNQSAELWTDSMVLKFLWSSFVLGAFCLVGWFFGWWALVVPVVAWIISWSFLYSITVPFVLFIVVLLILIPFRGY